MRTTGTYVTYGTTQYFIPSPLPPYDPPLQLSSHVRELHDDTCSILSKLNNLASHVPHAQRFIKSYCLKEALLSSDIEGIHTTIIDVLTQQLNITQRTNKEAQLVLNYVQALEVAQGLMSTHNLPIATRLILKLHEVLMSQGTGDTADPGNLRKLPVRVGKLIPPPAQELARLLRDLEQYINTTDELPTLVKAGLVHVQFETIHPFLDGNGRVGRLLIVIMLLESGLLQKPLLYPSYALKKYRAEYYDRLDRVRTHGDFEGWIDYFIRSLHSSAHDAYMRAQELVSLTARLNHRITTETVFAAINDVITALLNLMWEHPITTATQIYLHINIPQHITDQGLELLCRERIISRHVSDDNVLYHFDAYLAILEKEF